MKILEKQMLTNVRLTDAQKEVLCKLYMNRDTPQVGMEDISNAENARNLIAARDLLVKLDLLDETEEGYVPSDKGVDVMQDFNLVDEGGELTDTGEEFAYKGQVDTSNEPETNPTPGEEDFTPYESFDLLKKLTKDQ